VSVSGSHVSPVTLAPTLGGKVRALGWEVVAAWHASRAARNVHALDRHLDACLMAHAKADAVARSVR
jgi:hypothetical protein